MLLPRFFSSRSRACRMIALAGICVFPCQSMAQNQGDLNQYLNQQAFGAVSEIIERGDLAYNRKDMQGAVAEYRLARHEARDKILPVTFRQAVDKRYAQALAQLGMAEANAGKLDIARPKIEEAYEIDPLAPGVAEAREQINDKLKFNPAATAKHAENVAQVQALLQKGFGAFDLGDFDLATAQFQGVLRIDPYNTSALRGMERISKSKSEIHEAARDHTRAFLLDQTAGSWQFPIPAEQVFEVAENAVSSSVLPQGRTSPLSKINNLIIPRVSLENVNIQEAVDYIRGQARRLDPSGEGVNIVTDLGDSAGAASQAIADRRFNVQMNNVPLSEVLRYVADMTSTQVRPSEFAIRLVAGSVDDAAMSVRTFRLSPSFFAGSSDSSDGGGDIFSDNSSGGLKIRRVDPKTFFERSGITFPQGATATYSANNSTLLVRNTASNLNLIEDIVAVHNNETPAQVIIKATFIEVDTEKLEELGFDWAVGFTSLGNRPGSLLGGGTWGSVYDNLASPPEGMTHADGGSLTAGLRSGSEVFPGNAIDSLIESGSERNTNIQAGRRAPGILSFRGVFNNADIEVVMRGLNQTKNADILQQPQIIARAGEKASFSFARELPYPTDYTEPQLPTSTGNTTSMGNFPVTPSHPTSFNTRMVGVTMEVEPTGLSEDRNIVDLQIIPELVEFDGFVNYGNPIMASSLDESSESGVGSTILSRNSILMPIFTKRGVDTKVTVASGHTVVLGGLMKSKKVTFNDKVPLLGDIPLVGRLFRSEGQKNEQKAIIIMVRVDVVDPSGQNINSLPKEL